MEEKTSRLTILVGESGLQKLNNAKVAICGVGGVGGYVTEAIARSFVNDITIIDGDNVCPSNLNRQIIALEDTIGRAKVQVMKERILSINPQAKVNAICKYITQENIADFDIWQSDYIIDAIDDVNAKIALIKEAKARGVKIISAMGAANRFDPMAFVISDISKATSDPLVKKVKKLLKEQGIESGVKVAYSKESPLHLGGLLGSNAFVPAGEGLAIASTVIKELLS